MSAFCSTLISGSLQFRPSHGWIPSPPAFSDLNHPKADEHSGGGHATNKNRVKRSMAIRFYRVSLCSVLSTQDKSAFRWEEQFMNTRKPTDYSTMYTALNMLMAASLLRVELYLEIGRLVSDRPEKGAAVVAAEYLSKICPDVKDFSPRNLRRMRKSY